MAKRKKQNNAKSWLLCYRIHHQLTGEWFEVEARSPGRCLELVRAECADRGWLVDDTWEERI